MEEPKLADNLTLKTVSKRGEREAHARALAFTPSGQTESVWVKRFREGLRIDAGGRKLDLHYSQIAEIKLVGQSTVSQQRSVVGRAVVGKVVAGETGALVGALSGLQNRQNTSNQFAITYWDPAAKDWKQVCLEDTGLNLPNVMDLAAEDMQACHRGEDPDQLPDPDAALKKILKYGLVGAVGIVVLIMGYNVLAFAAQGVSNVVSSIFTSTPSVSSGPDSTRDDQAKTQGAQVAQAALAPLTASSSVATVAAVAAPAASQAIASDPVQQARMGDTAPASGDAGATTRLAPATPETQPLNLTAKIDEPAGPSFDCAKARSFHEQRVCGNPSLAKVDVEMAAQYRAAMAAAKVPHVIKLDQGKWLRELVRCRNDGCLAAEYASRLDQLRRHQP